MIITVTVRARYCDGTLQLLEPLDVVDLEEGGEVEMTVRGILLPDSDTDADDSWAELGRAIRERRNSPWVTTARYCGGVFTPVKPLGFEEGEVVRLTVGKISPDEGEANELIQITFEHRVPAASTPEFHETLSAL